MKRALAKLRRALGLRLAHRASGSSFVRKKADMQLRRALARKTCHKLRTFEDVVALSRMEIVPLGQKHPRGCLVMHWT